MFQVQSHKAAHHQNSQIDHYIFENTLLMERNALLREQNQRLLDELEECHRRLQDKQHLKAQRIIEEYKYVLSTSTQDLSSIEKQLGSRRFQSIGRLIKQMRKSQADQVQFGKIQNGLLSIIKELAEGYQQLKYQNIKEKVADKQERLQIRRHARQNTQTVLHIIKEPESKIQTSNNKLLNHELAHQRQLFEKLVRKVKREDVPIKQIQGVLDMMERSHQLRLSLRSQESELTLLQRQFELGWIEPASLNQTILKIQDLSQQLAEIKRSIEVGVKRL